MCVGRHLVSSETVCTCVQVILDMSDLYPAVVVGRLAQGEQGAPPRLHVLHPNADMQVLQA